jgi:hypothetical protein
MDKVRFKGWFAMKKLVEIKFIYEDGMIDSIIDPRACLLFQSRCNSNGLLSGMEDFIVSSYINKNGEEDDVK